uniref:Uncharacterized protein n=1 Tax=Anguilla anguilla TaxID=7936 RepID=A0A0E9SSG8_ANGAN
MSPLSSQMLCFLLNITCYYITHTLQFDPFTVF